MIRNIKVFAIALVCGLAGLNQPALAKPSRVEPSYYFTAFSDIKYDTLQAAYDSVNPSQKPDPETKLVHWRVVGMQAPVKLNFINGRLISTGLRWEVLNEVYCQ
ncbi:hypothetical protein HF313_15485 [Massilia atriviolacea]|uniref:Uncharacterized protein n=1 Tax=Massilia atriviolacea TaxID=2495579 RepID=A0A430HC25_9BURK|nr:hypothetical protein [Massilia atriviolacea]RSZ55067.1 hypothetical protein EJB06_31425 [Massilia atriviolacea]